MGRSYRQYCGLARALDVVGERWNLLIVRQLLMAPARYRELLEGLPGVATNLLTDRLRDLETAGVVERRLAEEGNAIRYALTPWGTELREPIESLIRWSTPLMTRGPGSDRFRAEWLVVALRALLAGKTTARRSQRRMRTFRQDPVHFGCSVLPVMAIAALVLVWLPTTVTAQAGRSCSFHTRNVAPVCSALIVAHVGPQWIRIASLRLRWRS